MDQAAVVFGIGLMGGAVSGFLGIGGGIVTAPLLLYVPGVLGAPPLSMHQVSGLTITQALFAGLLGAFSHARRGTVDPGLAGVMASVIFVASLAGAMLSRYVSADGLLAVFGGLVLVAGGLLFRPPRSAADRPWESGGFSRWAAAGVASVVGVVGGLVGQGGSFLLIPAMTGLLGVPLRVAMGSNLVIVCFSSLAGFLGKAATGQVAFPLALALVAGVVPGVRVGARWHHRTPTPVLRLVLGLVLLVACSRIAWDLFVDRAVG
ncbi:MAG: sulfite exporter TauE/SafE family protein [Deltaproteobacteria bacterium]|nr:sulfite exporter TauE/SafE family protein [Deltaproteobacteria bacterium]